MSLVVCESFDVETNQGNCSIDLCIGSVTKADTKNPVDVLVISAYPGDYTPTRTSVIGALKYDLKVNVRALASDKERDYRKLFSCWWSKKLPHGLPFKRLLCFEGSFKRDARPPSTVSEVFRSLVSLCEENEVSVMMPLLSTGDQCYGREMMLRLIIETSVHWMKIGLPLKKLKIVLHQKDTASVVKENKKLIDYFEGLKGEWLQIESNRNLETTHFVYDYYITNASQDEDVANRIKLCLQTQYENCKIFHQQQDIDDEKSWQDHIYDVMVTCSRVLILLSPDFLEDLTCIEKYNIALCCSRNMERNYLAPIYVTELKELPTYMGLIQYMDIRPVTDDSISTACKSLPTLGKTLTTSDFNSALKEKPVSLDSTFDVFISYSHKNHEIATQIYNYIKQVKPHWTVFLDQDSLKAGHAWQSRLYKSIEDSKSILVLLSNAYLESKVCQEEYNLARCLSDDSHYSLHMVEVKVEQIKQFPKWCTPSSLERLLNLMVLSEKRFERIVDWLDQDRDWRGNCSDGYKSTVININNITSMWRKEFAKENYPISQTSSFSDSKILESFKNIDLVRNAEDVYDVIIVCHQQQNTTANNLQTQLLKHLPTLKTIIVRDHNEQPVGHQIFDKSKLLVPLLSKEYYDTPILMEYFNTALCRHRFDKEIVICPIIVGKLPMKPVYPRITFCMFSTEDKFWREKSKDPLDTCIYNAAVVISNIVTQSPKNTNSFKTLLSILELEEWTFCKERGENRDVLSPLLFGNATTGHVVLIEDHGDKKVSLDNNTNDADDSSLLKAQGSHAVSLDPVGKNEKEKEAAKNVIYSSTACEIN